MLNLSGAVYAMGGAPSGSGAASGLGVLIPFLFMFVILYFLLIRPEKKKEKDRKQMIASIKQGDRVLTIGGIYGTVHSIKDDDTVILKIAEGAKVEFTRSSIQLKLP